MSQAWYRARSLASLGTALASARKSAGLEVGDRIVLALTAAPEHAEALEAHAGLIAGETLAVGFAVAQSDDLEATIDSLESPGNGVFISGARALGAQKAPLAVTIDVTQVQQATQGDQEEAGA